MNPETRACRDCKENFTVEAEDFAFYDKMQAPAPTLCPECRFKRRALFRNEMNLYTNRSCGLCSKKVISVFAPNSPYIIYCQECFDGDKWDPYSYAQDYDPARPFFEQFGELMRQVPKRNLGNTVSLGPNVNSDYTNVASSNKNCYLIFNSSLCEDSMYSRGMKNNRDAVDIYFGVGIERCYEGVNVNESNGVVFGQNVVGSLDSIFLRDSSGCQNCFGGVNLRNKSYVFFDEQLSKEEYEKRTSEIRGSYAKMKEAREKFEEFSLQFPRRANSNIKTVNSTGDYLFQGKNLHNCFEITDGEDTKYAFSSKNIKDSYDTMGYGYNSELLLDCCATGLSSRIIGSYWAENCSDVQYSYFVRKCQNVVGCDAIKNGTYCILNKKYTEAEYKELQEKIRAELVKAGEYGMFMPPALAPFSYNETIGQDNFPMTKEAALAAGYRWQDDMQVTKGKETLQPEQIPDHIKDVPDTIIQERLRCISCERNYIITPAELKFYRTMILPIPRPCFYCRHQDRIKRRGPMRIFDRICAKCSTEIKTTYAPERPEIVYCESCYQKEVL